ncbi:MAG: hypothetical protein Q9188_006942 [Gyalolechia gomerana]
MVVFKADVRNPTFVYLTIGKGISKTTANFNGLNFTSQFEKERGNTVAPYQVVTHSHNGASHTLFVYPDAARKYDLTDLAVGQNWAIEFPTETTSIMTECTFATAIEECDIRSDLTNSPPNNTSTPFVCYDDFSEYSRSSAIEPFHFYAATAVNSIDLQSFQDQSCREEGEQSNSSLTDAGLSFIAFALDCQKRPSTTSATLSSTVPPINPMPQKAPRKKPRSSRPHCK